MTEGMKDLIAQKYMQIDIWQKEIEQLEDKIEQAYLQIDQIEDEEDCMIDSLKG